MLKCTKSWLNFEFHPEVLAQLPFVHAELTKLIFGLRNELCTSQAKCISHLIISTSGTHSSPALETAKLDIGKRVVALMDQYVGLKHRKHRVGPVLASKNEAMIEAFRTIFTTLSQTYMDKIIGEPKSDLYPIMLELLRYPQGRYSDICKFWKRLFKEIYATGNAEVKVARLAGIKDIIQAAILICLDRMQISGDVFMQMNKKSEHDEEFDDILDQRYYFSKILKYIGACIGAQNAWAIVSPRLRANIEYASANPGLPAAWANLEGTLTCVGEFLICILRLRLYAVVSTKEDIVALKDLFPLVMSMTKEAVQLQRAIIGILSAVAPVISGVEDVLKLSLKHLFECLQVGLLRDEASDVLLNILDRNKDFICEHHLLDDLLSGRIDLLKRIVYEKMSAGTQYDKTTENLAKMYAQIICRQPPELVKTNLERMIRPVAVVMLACVSAEALSKDQIELMYTKTHLLATIFSRVEDLKKLEERNPVIQIYAELSPVLLQGMKKFYTCERVLEVLVALVKHTMRSIGTFFFPYLDTFATQVVEGYRASPLAPYLYCAEFTASVYGGQEKSEKLLGDMFNMLGKHTFEVLGGGGYTNYPHLVEDFFGMSLRYIKYCPKAVFMSLILEELLQFSIALIGYEHIEGSKALYLFLAQFFNHFDTKRTDLDPKESAALGFLLANGPIIAKKLILCLEGAPHKQISEYIIDLLVEMLEALPTQSATWIGDAVQFVSFPDVRKS